MIAAPTNTLSQDPILGPFPKVMSSIKTLYRLSALSKHFENISLHSGKDNAQFAITNIKQVWAELYVQVQGILSSANAQDANIMEKMKKQVKKVLKNNITDLQEGVFEIYISLVDQAKDAKALDEGVCKFLKDVQTVNTIEILSLKQTLRSISLDIQKQLKNSLKLPDVFDINQQYLQQLLDNSPSAISNVDMESDDMEFDNIEDNVDLKENVTEIKSKLNAINFATPVFQIYADLIDAAKNLEALDKCARKCLNDLQKIITFDIRKTVLGLSGPTHIISYNYNYNRNINNVPQNKSRNYVVKWTNSNEIVSSRIYEALAKYFIQKNLCLSFLVPETASLDFDNQIYSAADYSHHYFEKEEALELQKSFHVIVSKGKSDTQIILMQKIIGSDLLDFVQTKYLTLPQNQKQTLFKKIGQLILIDLLIGNPDRLGPHTSFNGHLYEFVQDSSANFGNLMIEWNSASTDQDLKVYAIDNSIDDRLISNARQKAAYKQFLQRNCKSTEMNGLAALITASLKSGLEKMIQGGKDVEQTDCESFLFDLQDQEIAQGRLKDGLCEMLGVLEKSLYSFWISPDSLNIREFLALKHNSLMEAISDRFEIFPNISRNSEDHLELSEWFGTFNK